MRFLSVAESLDKLEGNASCTSLADHGSSVGMRGGAWASGAPGAKSETSESGESAPVAAAPPP
eukprot:4827662-Prymnesium_polylepis.1